MQKKKNGFVLPYLKNDAYHAHTAISSSNLKKLLNCTPARLKYLLDNKDDARSEALTLGSLLHALVLEPETLNPASPSFENRFVIERQPLADKTRSVRNGGSKETWEAMKKLAESTGAELIKYDTWTRAKEMAAAVRSHPFAAAIQQAQCEISLFTTFQDAAVKARLDAWHESTGTIIDLKTCRHTLTDRNIQRVIVDNAYHFSAAMYKAVAEEVGFEVRTFVWCFIENFPPYSCRFVEASPKMLEVGHSEFLHCLEKYKTLASDDKPWPAYPDTVDTLDLPDWYANREILIPGEVQS